MGLLFVFAGDRVGDGASHIIIGVVSALSLVILTISVLSVLLVLWRRHRKRKTPSPTENVAYNIHNDEIKTDPNEAYGTVDSDVVATTNPAYVTTSGSGERDIPTSTNEAYISTDISTSDNPAYVPGHVSGTNTLVYDYARV